MQWIPHVTVATVVEHNGRYLMVEEHCSGRLLFNQPAGHLEANESLQQAAVRETLEETGCTVQLKGLVGVGLYTSPNNGITYHRTTFFAELIAEDSDYQLDEGIERAAWMSYDEIVANAARMRSDMVIGTIDQYQNGHRYPLNMIF